MTRIYGQRVLRKLQVPVSRFLDGLWFAGDVRDEFLKSLNAVGWTNTRVHSEERHHLEVRSHIVRKACE